MQDGQLAPNLAERALLVMPISEQAEQLAATLRELGTAACEIVQDADSVLRRSLALRPELVLLDLPPKPSDATLAMAAALRGTTRAPLVYLCDPEAVPPISLIAHCASGIEKPVSRARLLRCLQGIAHHGESDRSQRERALSFQDELLASLAHELRAPLQGVSGFTQYLLEGKAGELVDAQRACLQQIELGAEHVLQVIQDVLDLSDRAADTLHVRTEVVDSELALREVLQVLQAFAIRRRVAVDVAVDDRLGHVVCDATRLKQVLYNLLSNALKHAPSGGKVEIALERAGADSFSLQVSDTGPGLTQPMLTHINNPAAEPRVGQLRGLELTRRILTALGGRLRARNREPTGAVLRVELPLAPSATHPYTRL